MKGLKKLGLWPNEEGGPMKKLVFFSALLAAVALAATPAHAQATKGENIVVMKDSATTKLPGGKSYMTQGNRQICTSADAKNPLNGASGDCDGACLIDAAGNATCMGSCAWVDHDGELVFITWDGQTAGSWKVAGGTGKWKASSGGGTWKNADSVAGNFARDTWEGTFSMKK